LVGEREHQREERGSDAGSNPLGLTERTRRESERGSEGEGPRGREAQSLRGRRAQRERGLEREEAQRKRVSTWLERDHQREKIGSEAKRC